MQKLDEPEFKLNQLYIVGDATPAGWEINNPYPMGNIAPNVLSMKDRHTGRDECPVNNSGLYEDEFLMPLVTGTVINKSGVADAAVEYVATGSPDSKWKVEDSGNYEIIIDASKGKSNITIAATWLGEIESGPELYLLGSVSGRWSSLTDSKWTRPMEIFLHGRGKSIIMRKTSSSNSVRRRENGTRLISLFLKKLMLTAILK